jgi:hypothetical protein
LLRLLAKLTRLAPRCPDEAGLLGEQHQPNRMDQPLAEKNSSNFRRSRLCDGRWCNFAVTSPLF